MDRETQTIFILTVSVILGMFVGQLLYPSVNLPALFKLRPQTGGDSLKIETPLTQDPGKSTATPIWEDSTRFADLLKYAKANPERFKGVLPALVRVKTVPAKIDSAAIIAASPVDSAGIRRGYIKTSEIDTLGILIANGWRYFDTVWDKSGEFYQAEVTTSGLVPPDSVDLSLNFDVDGYNAVYNPPPNKWIERGKDAGLVIISFLAGRGLKK